MAKIIVEFSGWVECDSDKVMFASLLTDDVITGTEWLKLSQDDQDNYILEDCIEAQKTALDGADFHFSCSRRIIIQNEDESSQKILNL